MLLPLKSNTKYKLTIKNVMSKAGHLIASKSFSFTTGDFIAPTTVMLSPSNNAIGISRSPNIQVQFSEAVQNVNNFTITLHKGSPAGDQITLGNIAAGDNNTYTFSPSAKLDEATHYYLVLSDKIKDISGNQLIQAQFNFTTFIKSIMISAGYEHECALIDSGGVKCWGKELQDGELGFVPVDVEGLSPVN